MSPSPVLSADLQASFCRLRVVSTIEAPSTEVRRVASKFDRNQKRHTKLFFQKKIHKTSGIVLCIHCIRHTSTIKLMVSTPTSEHEGFLGLPDHDVLHWRALRPSLGEILGGFLPCLGGEVHPSKAVFRRLYMYIYTYIYMWYMICIYIYMIYIYVCKLYIYKQYTLIHERQASCVFLLCKKLEVKKVTPDDLNESSNFYHTKSHDSFILI